MPNTLSSSIAARVDRIERSLEGAANRLSQVGATFQRAAGAIGRVINPESDDFAFLNSMYQANSTMYRYACLPRVLEAYPVLGNLPPKPKPVDLSKYLHPAGPQKGFKLDLPPERKYSRMDEPRYIKFLYKSDLLGPRAREVLRLQYKASISNIHGRLIHHLVYKARTIAWACRAHEEMRSVIESSIGENIAELSPSELEELFNQVFLMALLMRLLEDKSLSLPTVFRGLVGIECRVALRDIAAGNGYINSIDDVIGVECRLQDALGLPTHHTRMIPDRVRLALMAQDWGRQVVDRLADNNYEPLIDALKDSLCWVERLKKSDLFIAKSKSRTDQLSFDLATFENDREDESSEAFKLSEQEALDYINFLAGEFRQVEDELVDSLTREHLEGWKQAL